MKTINILKLIKYGVVFSLMVIASHVAIEYDGEGLGAIVIVLSYLSGVLYAACSYKIEELK